MTNSVTEFPSRGKSLTFEFLLCHGLQDNIYERVSCLSLPLHQEGFWLKAINVNLQSQGKH